MNLAEIKEWIAAGWFPWSATTKPDGTILEIRLRKGVEFGY